MRQLWRKSSLHTVSHSNRGRGAVESTSKSDTRSVVVQGVIPRRSQNLLHWTNGFLQHPSFPLHGLRWLHRQLAALHLQHSKRMMADPPLSIT